MSLRQGARQFFERRGAPIGPTARDYVQDGLVAMWDGIENAGWGVHDPNATTWKDLSGRENSIPLTAESWGSDYFICSDESGRLDHFIDGIETIEFVGRRTSSATYQVAIGLARQPSNYYSRYVAFSSGYANFGSYLPSMLSNENVVESLATNFSDLFRNGEQEEPDVGAGDYFGVGSSTGVVLGRSGSDKYPFGGDIYAIRLYSRALTADEIAANYAIDKARFNLP